MTDQEWEETTSVGEVAAARDTEPAPPPTEPAHDPPTPPDTCACTPAQLAVRGAALIGERCPRCGGVMAP